MQKLVLYKQLLDADIQLYSKRLLAQSQKYTRYSGDVMEVYCAFLLRGGKRLRGALVLNAYEMLGGTDEQLGLRAARAIEMLHAHLLIVDDICDRSKTRRGGPTTHVALAEYHRQHRLNGDSEHFGTSEALNIALLGSYIAQLELVRLPIDDTTKLELLHDLDEALFATIHGQINDLFNEALQQVEESQVLRTLTWKTAYYSFLNPLRTGATLAKANPAELEALREYSEHIGLAFQIVDDILGTFGNEFESGKSPLDDLKEGKATILITRALSRADPEQKRQLREALGNQNLTNDDHERCKQIIEETGAFDYARQLANQHAAQAVAALENPPDHWRAENVAFLRDLAEYVTRRGN